MILLAVAWLSREIRLLVGEKCNRNVNHILFLFYFNTTLYYRFA